MGVEGEGEGKGEGLHYTFTLSHELMSRVWPVRRSFLTESIVVSVSIREIAYTFSQETIHGFQQIRCRGANNHHYCEGNE